MVGDVEYPGSRRPARRSTASTSAIPRAGRVLRAAHDQDLNTPIRVFARDRSRQHRRAPTSTTGSSPSPSRRAASSSTTSSSTTWSRPSSRARQRSSPRDRSRSSSPSTASCASKNNEKIASFAKQTAPELLWRGVVFHTFKNNGVQSAFADYRTYVYKGKEVDQQVHLGFDLASFTNAPIVAGEPRQGAVRRRARHLRQLRHPRSRHGRAVALRPPVLVRRARRRHGGEGTAARPQRHHRPGAAAITCTSRCSSTARW